MNQAVKEALERCFADKRIVFWYDEGGRCRGEFDELDIAGVDKLVIDGNEFGIKYKVLAEKPEGKFLIYSPKAKPAEADDWLLDLYLSGMSFSTDPVSMVMSEMSFPEETRGVITEKMLPFFKSEQRKHDVKNLLAQLERRPTAEEVVLALMCAVCRVRDHLKIEHVLAVLLKELPENKTDRIDELAKYGLEPALWKRLGIDYGYQNGTNPSIVDFANKLFHDAFYPAIRDERYQLSPAALSFFNDWKNDARTRKAFLALADAMASKLEVARELASVDVDAFGALDVYREIDERIVKGLLADVERGSVRVDDIARIVGARKDGCRYADFSHRYQALEAAARFFASLSSADLSSADAADAIAKYAGSWYQIDQQYRLFLEHYSAAKKENADVVDLFAALKDKVDGFYLTNYLMKQSVGFQDRLNGLKGWTFGGIGLQRNFWRDRVASAGVNTCVIISDALRYEVAAELAEQMAAMHRYTAKVEPMVGVLPSYTQLGMAALLPHGKLDFVGTDDGAPEEWVLADGKSTAGLEARRAILAAATPAATAYPLEEVLDMPKKEFREFQNSAKVIYVYHNAIDRVGDKRDTEEETPQACREAIDDIVRLAKRIGSENRIYRILVTSDHGFLYQDRELGPEQYVDDFDDGLRKARVVKTRFALGAFLDRSQALANYTTEELGLEVGADVRIAKGIMRMRRQGSGVKYVHGGASLQEIVVPVVEIQHVRSGQEDVSPVEAEILVDGVGRITTNRFNVSVYQTSPVGDGGCKRVVRLGLHAPDGTLLSDEVQLVLDSEAENVPDRTKSTILTLNHAANELGAGSVELRMETGRERGASGRMDWDVYKAKPMTLRLAVQNFFD